MVWRPHHERYQGGFITMKNEVKHTAHSSYRCEYHIVFAPKYRRKVIYKELRRDVIKIIKKLCKEMKVEIIEGEACPDHIHMLVSIPPYMSIAQFVGSLKSKSALMIFDRHANLKYKYGSRKVLCGYSGKEYKENPGAHPEPTGGGSGGGPDITEGVYGPVYG